MRADVPAWIRSMRHLLEERPQRRITNRMIMTGKPRIFCTTPGIQEDAAENNFATGPDF
jgi:hypothetical protein